MNRNGIKRRIYPHTKNGGKNPSKFEITPLAIFGVGVYDKIKVDDVPLLTMFDTGAWNSYIAESAVERSGLEPQKVKRPFWTSLGGRKHLIKADVTVDATIHKLPMRIQLFVIDEIGRTRLNGGNEDIEILFGLPLMEVWGIEFDIKHKKLDLSDFSKEFVEF